MGGYKEVRRRGRMDGENQSFILSSFNYCPSFYTYTSVWIQCAVARYVHTFLSISLLLLLYL